MIISFANKDTETIWYGTKIKKLPTSVQEIGRRNLRILNYASDLADLRIPPANRLEKLSGRLKPFYRIRINEQWRVILNGAQEMLLKTTLVSNPNWPTLIAAHLQAHNP